MTITERRASVELRAAERPDVQALRSALSRVEHNFDAILELQEEEIQRLRRLVVVTVRAYRNMEAGGWKTNGRRFRAFVDAMGSICLESDAIEYGQDLAPKKRPTRRRG